MRPRWTLLPRPLSGSCQPTPLNLKSLGAVGIVVGSLTLMVCNYEPDLAMLFATVLLLTFDIVTPGQGQPFPTFVVSSVW